MDLKPRYQGVLFCGALLTALGGGYAEAQQCSGPSTPYEFVTVGRKLVVDSTLIYPNTDLRTFVRQKYGLNAEIADWQDIKRLLRESNQNIDFIRSLHLELQTKNHACGNYLITNRGETHVNGKRYVLTRHDGQVPPGWTSLDNSNSHQIDLGRWNWPGYPIVLIRAKAKSDESLVAVSQGVSGSGINQLTPIRDPITSACTAFLRTNPDVLRTVNAYTNGSAQNSNMTSDETVKYISSTITESLRNTTNSNIFNRDASMFYQCLAHIDRSTISNLWPNLNAVIAGKEKREAIEAETLRQERAAQQKAEQEKQAAEAERARKQATIDAQPYNSNYPRL